MPAKERNEDFASFSVKETVWTRRSWLPSTRLTNPFLHRRCTATLTEPGLKRTDSSGNERYRKSFDRVGSSAQACQMHKLPGALVVPYHKRSSWGNKAPSGQLSVVSLGRLQLAAGARVEDRAREFSGTGAEPQGGSPYRRGDLKVERCKWLRLIIAVHSAACTPAPRDIRPYLLSRALSRTADCRLPSAGLRFQPARSRARRAVQRGRHLGLFL